MATLILASAAAAALTIASWGPSTAPVDGTAGVDPVVAPDQVPERSPTHARDQTPAPAPAAPVAVVPPQPVVDDGLADAPDEEPMDLSVCGASPSLEVQAFEGKLDPQVLACLEGLLAPDSRADAVPVLQMLTVNAFAAGDKVAWERRALQLASVTEDPDLHYKLALHYSKGADTAPMSLHHAGVALSMADRWPDAVRAERTGRALKIRAAATMKLLMADPDPTTQSEAAEAARAWLRHARQVEHDEKAARKACVALADAAWCDAE